MQNQILEFINNHLEWAAIIVFAIAFLESIAIVGLLMPGWILLLAVGGLIGSDVLPFYPIVIAAYLGAVIGEYISYYAGYYYHEKVLQLSFFEDRKRMIDKAKIFFRKHGILGVFVSRFFGPARAVVPLVAGICEMKKRHFFWVNILSGIIWAPAYLIPGILLGAAFSVEKDQAYAMMALMIAITGLCVYCFNCISEWKNTLQNNKRLIQFKSIVSGMLSIFLIIYFVQSEYWQLLEEIMQVVVSRL